ncbi:MAG: adenylate/guanylate cyclase domain-containing protein [Burkholderiaceae bacterium]
MSYGYLVESVPKSATAQPVWHLRAASVMEEMVKDPASYSMQAQMRELTVLFCDMQGFTQISETMNPVDLQGLLNRVFNQLTAVIRERSGTIDKYAGDCVLAFWGAPVKMPDHADLAVHAALEMAHTVRTLNEARVSVGGRHCAGAWPEHR